MLKRIAIVLLAIVGLSLQSCTPASLNLKSYVNTYQGYEFLYPNGWVEVKVNNGPDVVLHDLIEELENVSVVINPISDNKTLAELGSPTEVGYRLSKNAIAPPDSGRQAELVSAESRQVGDELYYLLEYAIKLPSQQLRHTLASVVVRRGKLFTFNLSTSEQRWEKAQDLFRKVVNSFSVY
ncbi:photosystem II reaction center PsbP [Leptolyngbya sp. 7M]|uniref:photosystem II reaction center PsbP n=1 Tax=Leptolyngbya sp. 7M TaxID=2812896 RepID=UPI001B8CC18B|nr:photosystem II reaction center PsbP [Leptolyngbya sp. 7M]QYO66838.1 photosystem II reaction center PsbP family protein [Leptolyngbya sp. 7M]